MDAKSYTAPMSATKGSGSDDASSVQETAYAVEDYFYDRQPDPNSPLVKLLASEPVSHHKMIEKLMQGQRFLHLKKNRFGFWKKKKCHIAISPDLEHLVYSPIKGESTVGKQLIPTSSIGNVTSSGMYDVSHPPAEFKDLKTFSIICLHETDRNDKKPKSSVFHLAPDLNCVQIHEIVEFTEMNGDIEVAKDGKVIEYDQSNPSVVHVKVMATGEVINVVGETLNRTTEENVNAANEAGNIVWDWYNGLVSIKALVANYQIQASSSHREESKRGLESRFHATGKSRKLWHEKMLTYGAVFKRAFVGARWKECKVVPSCYIRCSTDLSQILYAPVSCFQGDNKTAHLFLRDENGTDADLERLSKQLHAILISHVTASWVLESPNHYQHSFLAEILDCREGWPSGGLETLQERYFCCE